MGAWTFHHAIIGGLAFEGLVSAEGPSIACQPSRDPLSGGGVALVVSGLRRFAPERIGRAPQPDGWWIVKYRDEERVFLPGFTPSDIERLTAEFGLVAVSAPEWCRAGPFLRSRAWSSLVE